MRDGAASNSQAIGWAFQAFACSVLLIVVSLLHINFSGPVRAYSLSFTFLPLIIIYLWPFQAHHVLSIWLVMLAGLLQDLLSGGPLGMWAIINTLIFLALDPVNTKRRYSLSSHTLIFACVVISAAGLSLLLGRMALGRWPILHLLALQGIAAILVFPLIYKFGGWMLELLTGSRGEGLFNG